MKDKSNYEKVILTIVALAALGGSGWMIYKSLDFGSTVQTEKVVPKKDFGEIPIEQVQSAIASAVTPTKPWIAPVRREKPVPLNKSVLLVLKEDQLFDLFLEEPQIRPPLTNSFLRENGLPYQHPNVADLDSDNDGFTNLEEFEGKTSPVDASKHPPITNKLFMVNRLAKDYRVILKSSSSPYQIATPDDLKRKNWFAGGPGESFGSDNRFTVVKLERKVVPDPKIGERDVSELTVKDNVRNNEVVLVKDVENNIADYSAELEFRLKVISNLTVPKDGLFRIPGFDATTYKLIEVNEDDAKIAPVNAAGELGAAIEIKKG
ncbi:hypothetical protein FEM03_05355 [Phragmitibacter flavus]|uniref:Uncharacterized protein n=1 Tax=Phragmitibacter flavus TaxID=2576071 RepID=A0A5R8KH10_9BACT|nr:Amuc_1099 family pilus-like system protein [Phragmitibacter flavus]TLD71572.1 hypothetical protein FEM03_05355 [Phragmitibacter flavus]